MAKYPGWRWDRDWLECDPDTAASIKQRLQLEVEANPIVAELLGPKGQTISRLRERPVVPFGYQRQDREPRENGERHGNG